MNGNVVKKLSKLEVKSTTIRGNFSTFSSRICNTEKSCKNVFWKTSHDYFSQYWPLHCKLTSLPYKSERKIEFGGQLRSGIANTDLNSLDHISRKSREQTLRCDVTAHEVPTPIRASGGEGLFHPESGPFAYEHRIYARRP